MANALTSVTYEDFSAGIDESTGPMARDARRFLQLDNFQITDAKKLVRRPPCTRLTGRRDVNTQGLLFVNGEYVTIAKAGDTVAPTLAGMTLTTLRFDNPEFCTTWELIDMVSVNEAVCALIRHTFSGTAVKNRIMLHVWDGKRPTWVDDPACPTSWSKTFPLHAYGAGTRGSYQDYRPVMAVSNDKLFITTPDGNLAFSGTNKPRVWTTRTAADILADGRWWYWVTPSTTGVQSVTIPIPYTDFTTAGTYGAYVMELCNTDGTWTQLTEVTGTPAAGQYRIQTTANRWTVGGTAETLLSFNVGDVDQLIRFRALARPAITIPVGGYLVPGGVLTAGTLTVEGASENYAMTSLVIPALAATTSYQLIAVSSKKPAAVTVPYAIAGTASTMPLNGQQRYWGRIVAVATTNGSGTAFSFDYTGTVSISASSALVVGVGTSFLSQAVVGQSVQISGEDRVIKFIRSDTQLELTEPVSVTSSGVAMTRDVRYKYAYQTGDTGNTWYAAREAEATFTLSGNADAGTLNSSLYDNSGEPPLALAPAQDRLFVLTRTQTQLWKTDQDPTNFRLLSTMAFGAGPNTAPKTATMDGFAVMPTHAGPRLFSPDGLNKDYIKMAAISDSLKTLSLPPFTTACWWGRMRVLVFASSSDPRLFAFSYHPDSKVGGWSVWTVNGLDAVDSLFTSGEDLYLTRGAYVWKFSAEADTYRDSTDGDTAYVSHARWLYNDLGKPGRDKHLVRLEVLQEGAATIAVYVNPSNPDDFVQGPVVSGPTQGRMISPLALIAPAVALDITTTDESGYSLYAIGFHYKLLGR